MNISQTNQFMSDVAILRSILTTRNTEEPCEVWQKPWVRAHLLWMLDYAVFLLKTDKSGAEANRWCGFVKGCMVCNGWITLDSNFNKIVAKNWE